MSEPISVILVEDSPEYRVSIELALKREDGIELTHQFGTAEQALRQLDSSSEVLHPDLILLDLRLPGLNGIEAIPWFLKSAPKTKIVVLSQSDQEENVLKAIQAGASGYLLKGSTRQQLADAIRVVLEGGSPLDPAVASYIVNSFKQTVPEGYSDDNQLTKRETEILNHLAEGASQTEIAERLFISHHTVGNHIRHIYEKLQVSNAPAAVHKAHRTGLFARSSKGTDSKGH